VGHVRTDGVPSPTGSGACPPILSRLAVRGWLGTQRGRGLGTDRHPARHVVLVRLVDLVPRLGRTQPEVLNVEAEDVEDRVIRDRPSSIRERVADPASLARPFRLGDVHVAPPGVGKHEPDESGADHQPDDQQPPVELGIHPGRVQGTARASRCGTPPLLPTAAGAQFTGRRGATSGAERPLHSLSMIDITPDPVFIRLFGFPVYWYGIAYAVGLAAVYWVLVREARFRGLDEDLLGTGMVIVAIAALAGGRLYHVIDQWALYRDNPITAVLPLTVQPDGSYAFAGFTGLGVPGGIITGTLAAWWYVRRHRQSFWRWADVVAPGLFVMQAIGRIGNFFNQELYGPPTTLPWGIRIDCAHRTLDYPCASFPLTTTHFHPLFLYESLSGLLGFVVLVWLARRWSSRLVPGDLLLIFFLWYGLTRFALEGFRSGNWTFFGIPTAQIVTLGFILFGILGLLYRHGPGRPARTAAEHLPFDGARPRPEDDEEAFWSDDDEDDDDEDLDDLDQDEEDEDPDEDDDDDHDDEVDEEQRASDGSAGSRPSPSRPAGDPLTPDG
jgi:phosphatidylglycerol---prolipoprotein diacylglyceryl transferase